MEKQKHWAYGGIIISELMDEKFIGRKLKPIENDYAFAMPNKAFKVQRLQEESYEIVKCNDYRGFNDGTVYLLLKGADDFYTMLCDAHQHTGMELI